MRVLWTVNVIPAPLAKALELPAEVLGGWIEAMAAELSREENIELAIACKTGPEISFRESLNGVYYFSLGYNAHTTKAALERRCLEIIESFVPDLIHIEGTEFSHAGAMLAAAKEKSVPTVVSMQGILNGYYQYQCGELQMDDLLLSGSLSERFEALFLHLRKTRWYRPRMTAERALIVKADNILGRTTWDRAHTLFLNPTAKYYACNRNLRAPFYETSWDIERIERHTIYVGNGYYALKGLHFLLDALPLLLPFYPDIQVYVAGYLPFMEHDRRPFYKRSYGAYLKKQIRALGLEQHIVFTGPLNADEVAERLARTHVYVLCSTIENSPNTLGEAMLVGTPCAAAYVGGVPDMAKDGREALFYRSNDPALLALCVKRIFDSDELAMRLSENARTRASATHDTQKNAEALRRIYQDILYGKDDA